MPENVARLILSLTVGKRTTHYWVVPLDPHPDVATKAWRLWRARDRRAFYDVAIDPKGHTTCTCPDAVYRSNGCCKHAKALQALGLLPKKEAATV